MLVSRATLRHELNSARPTQDQRGRGADHAGRGAQLVRGADHAGRSNQRNPVPLRQRV
jgi:hypothetical protein